MLQYSCCTSRAPALTVLALADDIHTVIVCMIDKCGDIGSFGKIGVV